MRSEKRRDFINKCKSFRHVMDLFFFKIRILYPHESDSALP